MKPTAEKSGVSKAWRLVTICVALAAIATACGSDPAPRTIDGVAAEIFTGTCMVETDTEVTIYSGRSENLIEPVLEAYQCETGVTVVAKYAGSAELALLLGEEGDKTPADVFLSRSPGPVGFVESAGLLGSVDSDVLNLVASDYRSTTDSWVGFSGRQRVAVYNTDAIAPADLPTSIFDLTQEQWKGRVAIPATNGSFVDWFTVFRDQHGTDVAEQWLVDMVANDASYYPNNRAIVEAAGRGEIDLGLVNHYYNYQEVEAIGDDHRALNATFSTDDIGSAVIITAASVTASSDNAAAANDLIGYLLSAPVQRYFTEETFEYPLAAGVAAASVLPPLDALEIGSVDFNALGSDFEESTRIIEATGIANS